MIFYIELWKGIFIFSSHSEDHGSGKHDWEIYSEWKNLWAGKICRKKFLGK